MRRTEEQTSFLFNKYLSRFRLVFICTLGAVFFTACVSTPPYEEYTLAREAIEAAKTADSAKYSPAYWLEAESSYRHAEQAYKLNQFEKARTMFNRSRVLAEKAENQARLKKFESGDVFQ